MLVPADDVTSLCIIPRTRQVGVYCGFGSLIRCTDVGSYLHWLDNLRTCGYNTREGCVQPHTHTGAYICTLLLTYL